MKTSSVLSVAVTLGLAFNSASLYAADMVQVAPHNTKVLFENDKVRVLETKVKPGEKVSKHTHPARVIYYFNPSKEQVTFEGKQPKEFTWKAGEVAYFDAVKLEMGNTGTIEIHNIVVELKDGQNASHSK